MNKVERMEKFVGTPKIDVTPVGMVAVPEGEVACEGCHFVCDEECEMKSYHGCGLNHRWEKKDA